MTIDEAIANYQGISNYLQRYYDPDAEVKLHITNGKCIEWFTEVAERLTELKEANRLLKVAVDDIARTESCFLCKYYDKHNESCQTTDDCFVWRYADEALKLIGGSENG